MTVYFLRSKKKKRLRHVSDAAEGPRLERPRAISTPNVHVLLVGALQGEEDLQLNQIVQLSILGTNSLLLPY